MSENRLSIPHFEPQVPGPMLEHASEHERYIYEQLSIGRQQNDWIIQRLVEGEQRFRVVEETQRKCRESCEQRLGETSKAVASLEKFRLVLTSKWAVVTFLAAGVLWPVFLAWLGALFVRGMEHRP